MKPIAIYGAGGLGREVLMLIRQINLSMIQWNPVGFFDDNIPAGQSVHSLPVLGGLEELNQYSEDLWLVLAFGDPQTRSSLAGKIQNEHISYATLVHPGVQLEAFQRIAIGEGCILAAGNILTTDIRIGDHVLLNLGCTLGHNVSIGSFCSIMPGCHISGGVEVEDSTYLGSGAVLINGIRVGREAVVGAGAVVLNHVEKQTTVGGVPARPLQKEKKF
jgi:sugar O-acyltransferase (sialic acid O-acetyltransferase NeuD family)